MNVTADSGWTENSLRDRHRHQPESSINIKLYHNRGTSPRKVRRGFLETVLTQRGRKTGGVKCRILRWEMFWVIWVDPV